MTNDMEQDRQDTQSAFTLHYTIINLSEKNTLLIDFYFPKNVSYYAKILNGICFGWCSFFHKDFQAHNCILTNDQ